MIKYYKLLLRLGTCMAMLLVILSAPTWAQEGSQGNTTIFGGAQMTLFGDHSFLVGASGTQPGIIKTIRTSPFGVLSYSESATYSGSSDASHVDGYVEKVGSSAFVFPVGNGTKMRTAGISAPSVLSNFKVAYWFSNPGLATLPAGAPFLTSNLGAGVNSVSTTEYWDVDGASAINLMLSWDAASNLNTLTGGITSNLIIVGYNSSTSKWESLGNAGGITGSISSNGTIIANGVIPDKYSAFTFGTAAATPDLTAAQFFSNTSLAVGESVDYVVAISNVGQVSTSDVIDFFVTRFGSATGLNIALSTASTINIDGDDFVLNNDDFNVVTTTGRFTFTSKSAPNVKIAQLATKYIGFTITRTGGGAGSTNSTVTITNGTGGRETPTNNNTIANPITKI